MVIDCKSRKIGTKSNLASIELQAGEESIKLIKQHDNRKSLNNFDEIEFRNKNVKFLQWTHKYQNTKRAASYCKSLFWFIMDQAILLLWCP
jgi:hypothetical protein